MATYVGTLNNDNYSGNEEIMYGLDGNDTLLSTAIGARIYGGDSMDTLIGDQGIDVLVGNGGNDYLYMGAGDDMRRFPRPRCFRHGRRQ